MVRVWVFYDIASNRIVEIIVPDRDVDHSARRKPGQGVKTLDRMMYRSFASRADLAAWLGLLG